jgi:hypothetical protein
VNQNIRLCIVEADSTKLLETEVSKLAQDGWRLIGEPAFVAPLDIRAPHWVQAMYLSAAEIEMETVVAGDSQHFVMWQGARRV